MQTVHDNIPYELVHGYEMEIRVYGSGGQKYIQTARGHMIQLVKECEFNSIPYLERKYELNDGTIIRTKLSYGVQVVSIYPSGGEIEITPSRGFRFTPWEDNCPDAVVRKKVNGNWEVEIVNLAGGTTVNGESNKQYLSFDGVDNKLRDSTIYRWWLHPTLGTNVYKDGYSIFNASYFILGATVYEGYFHVFEARGASIQTYYAPQVNAIDESNKDSINWTAGDSIYVDTDDVTGPLVFAVGGNVGHYTWYATATDTSNTAAITIKVNEGNITFAVATVEYTGTGRAITTVKSKTPYITTESELTGVIGVSYGTGTETQTQGPYCPGDPDGENIVTFTSSGCLDLIGAGNWIYAGAYSHPNPHSELRSKCYWPDDHRARITYYWDAGAYDYTDMCNRWAWSYSVTGDCHREFSYTADTFNMDAGAVVTTTNTPVAPLIGAAGMLDGVYSIGEYTETLSHYVTGYKFDASSGGTSYSALVDFVAADPGSLVQSIEANAPSQIYYAGGVYDVSGDYLMRGHIGDYSLDKHDIFTNTNKKSPVTYRKAWAEDIRDHASCTVGDIYQQQATCTGPGPGRCGNYIATISGSAAQEYTFRYIPNAFTKSYIDVTYSYSYPAVHDGIYRNGDDISAQPQTVETTARFNLVIDEATYGLAGLDPIIKNETFSPPLQRNSPYEPSVENTLYDLDPLLYYEFWYSSINDINGNMLLSIYAAYPNPYEDWTDDIKDTVNLAHRVIYDSEKRKLIDLVELYNEAIHEYNLVEGTSYSEMQTELLIEDYELTPLYGMGVL